MKSRLAVDVDTDRGQEADDHGVSAPVTDTLRCPLQGSFLPRELCLCSPGTFSAWWYHRTSTSSSGCTLCTIQASNDTVSSVFTHTCTHVALLQNRSLSNGGLESHTLSVLLAFISSERCCPKCSILETINTAEMPLGNLTQRPASNLCSADGRVKQENWWAASNPPCPLCLFSSHAVMGHLLNMEISMHKQLDHNNFLGNIAEHLPKTPRSAY